MKERFKKIDLLVHYREREQTTEMLQELGAIHVELNHNFRNEAIETLELRATQYSKAIAYIEEHQTTPESTSRQMHGQPKQSSTEVVEQVLRLKHQQENDQQEAEILQKNRYRLGPWGDFDVDKIRRLENAGLQVHFCVADVKKYDEEELGQLTYTTVNEIDGKLYLVVISKEEGIRLPFETIQLPSMRIAEISERERTMLQRQNELQKQINELSVYLPFLKTELDEIDNQRNLVLANGSGTDYAEGRIIHLVGWFPGSMEERVTHYMNKQQLSFSVSDPKPGDKVPVLLKNPKYPKLFESITRIFQLPAYYELDLTPFIAVFYPILFAYCLGDAGYGLVLLIAAAAGWFTFLKHCRNMAVLGIVLGLFTTLMGIVKSGSVLGIPTVGVTDHAVLQYLARYVVIPDDRGVVFNAFNVALLIGVVQIITGIVVSIVNKIKYYSLAEGLPQIGKLFMVIGLIWMFLADMQGVEVLQPLALARQSMLAVGVLLVIFFHDMSSPILARAASGLLPLFFIVTGILGDVLSYVRLFALGVASAVLGLVVNQIGMQIMGDTWWGWIVGVLFLLLGHTLNFALAALGSFVHPLRLTFVEFYNNAQFEGGGIPYNPLRKIKMTNTK